ncbi:hypothetical protein Tco_1115815 [Tanacetum coccineum]
MLACNNPRQIHMESENRPGFQVSSLEQHWAQDLDYESEFEQQEGLDFFVLPLLARRHRRVRNSVTERVPRNRKYEAVIAVTNFEKHISQICHFEVQFISSMKLFDYLHEDSETGEHQEVELIRYHRSFLIRMTSPQVHNFVQTAFTGAEAGVLVLSISELMPEPSPLSSATSDETAWVKAVLHFSYKQLCFFD